MAPSLLTKREAAARARMHVGTLNNIIRGGRGPALTVLGGKALVREDSLARWIDAQTEHHPEQAAAA